MKSLYLYPGQMAVSAEPTRISTLLGSCVGVALHDPRTKCGGLNHYLLPVSPSGPAVVPSGSPGSLRYGDASMKALLGALLDLGARKQDLRAKVYGGNNVVEGLSAVDVGHRNIEFALGWLRREGIQVVESETGASCGSRISLRTDTFEVEYRLISSSEGAVELPPRRTGSAGLASSFSSNAASGKASGMGRPIRVLVVDDSATVRNVFRKVLEASGRVEVVGVASDPFEGRELIVRERPDVVLLDIEMPRMNGVDFLAKVMEHLPTPVIMVSSLGSHDAAALRCLELGAVEFVHKPTQFDPNILRSLADILLPKIVAAASEPIERLRTRARSSLQGNKSGAVTRGSGASAVDLVLVGGNAGSQFAFQDFLAGLAQDTPPVVASLGSVAPFAAQFCLEKQGATAATLRLAKDGARLTMGDVHLVPYGHQARVSRRGGGYVLDVAPGGLVCGQSPSAEELFVSVAASGNARGVVGVLLSGFGTDGVDGLVKLRESGGHTIVVSPDTAPFPFVPGEAIRQGAADEVCPPAELASALFRHRSRSVS